MGRSQSRVLIYRRYKVIVINTFIIVPHGEVNESDSVRGYLRLWKQRYPSCVCFDPALRAFWREEGYMKRSSVCHKCSSMNCGHESGCLMNAHEPACSYQARHGWKCWSRLSVCFRPSLHQPPLKEPPWGEQGGPMLLLEQYIRKLPSSFSRLQSGEVSKVLEDPKWAVLCSSDHEQKLLSTVVQAS